MEVRDTTTISFDLPEATALAVELSAYYPFDPQSTQLNDVLHDVGRRVGTLYGAVYVGTDDRQRAFTYMTWELPKDTPLLKKFISVCDRPTVSNFDSFFSKLRKEEYDKHEEKREEMRDRNNPGIAAQPVNASLR